MIGPKSTTVQLFTTVLPYPYSIPVGLLIGAAYQASLNLGLEAFIMRPDRDEYNIFDANREGICSLFGYIFAYCLTLIVIRIVALIDGQAETFKKTLSNQNFQHFHSQSKKCSSHHDIWCYCLLLTSSIYVDVWTAVKENS